MATSAPAFVITAGVLVMTNDAVNGSFTGPKEVKRFVAMVVGAFVGAGLDKVLPGLGTGLAVIVAITAAIKVGPSLLGKVFPS
jgi:hypothetical protein